MTADSPPKFDDLLTLHAACQLLAARALDEADNQRSAEDRVRHRIVYAESTGKLRCQPDGKFRLGDVAAWARQIWPGTFDDLPLPPILGVAEIAEGSDALASDALALPDTLEACHAMIAELHAEIRSLRAMNSQHVANAVSPTLRPKKNARRR